MPLQLLASAAIAVPVAQGHAERPIQSPLKAATTTAAGVASAVERGGFGSHLDGWPLLVVVGAGTVFLLAKSGGE